MSNSLFSGKAFQVITTETPGIIELKFDRQNEAVNVFGQSVVEELKHALQSIPKTAKGLLITSGKDAFCAGADITEFLEIFKKPEAELAEWIQDNQKNFDLIEDLPFPTVVAIQGFALGGGFEFALSADYRIATPKTKIGLPETKLGIVPGWGGTVRLPRLIGADLAIEWMTTGNAFDVEIALKSGAVDAVVPADQLRSSAIQLLKDCVSGKIPQHQRRHQKTAPLSLSRQEKTMVFSTSKAGVLAATQGHFPAPVMIVDLMEKSGFFPRKEAMKAEAEHFAKICKTPQAKALVRIFLADQAVKKAAKAYKNKSIPVQTGAVLGAGIMGGGIAVQAAMSKLPMIMKDLSQDALHKGMNEALSVLEKAVEKKKLTVRALGETLLKIKPTLEDKELTQAQLVIEAVTENLAIKQRVLAATESVMAPEAILTSNTSTISITQLSESLQRPENFCGMHFFNPVPRMPLVEIIRGKKSSETAVATAVQVALQMGKTPVVVNDCPGFLVNRVLFAYFTGFNRLLQKGADFVQIDQVMERYGWPMGPAYLLDVVGIDTAVHASSVMSQAFPDRMGFDSTFTLNQLFQEKKYGQKTGQGFYGYSVDAKGKPKKEITEQSPPRGTKSITPDEIIDSLMLPFIFESRRCLNEGIVQDPLALDLAMILGLGYPTHRGGPLCTGETLGESALKEKSMRLEPESGALYHYISPTA